MTAQFLVLTAATPEDNDVVAGWLGFGVFLGLAVAVALLAWSFVRQLRKAQAAKDAGVYGDPVKTDSRADSDADSETEA